MKISVVLFCEIGSATLKQQNESGIVVMEVYGLHPAELYVKSEPKTVNEIPEK